MGDRLIEEYFKKQADQQVEQECIKRLIDYILKHKNRSFPLDFKEKIREFLNNLES